MTEFHINCKLIILKADIWEKKNKPTHHLSPILHSRSTFSKGVLGELGSEILPEQYRMQMPIFQKNLSEDQHSVYVSRSDRITVNQDPLSILQFSKKNDFLVLLLKGTKVAAMIPGRKRPAFYTDASLGIKDEDSRIPPQEFPLTSQSLFCADTTAAPPQLPWPRRGQTQAFLPIRDARQSGYRF